MAKRNYNITIYNTKKDCIVRSTTVFKKDIESVNGIGNYIESLDSILKENEQIRVSPYWE